MSKPLLIIDSNQICYIAFYKTGNLSHRGKSTGIIYGFLTELLKIAKVFEKENPIIVFAWDSRTNYRKDIYEPYKQGRKESRRKSGIKKKHFRQFTKLRRDILPEIGFKNNFIAKGFESDDIIGKLCQKYQLRKKVIVSSDEDLYQLLDIETSMYKMQAKKFYTAEDLFKQYGLEKASDWIKIKALAGCSTDNVKGITGVGYKTASAYLTGNLKTTTKAYKKLESKKGKRIYKRNLPLVTVPYPMKELKDFTVKRNKLDFDSFYSICESLGFRSITKDFRRWIKTFNNFR